jgi:ornithine carbamoyltransferase
LEVKSKKAMRRHFLDLFDIQKDEALDLLDLAVQLKQSGPTAAVRERLQGRLLGLIFEKPSLRTRVSFEAAMASLGGSSLFLRGEEVGLGVRESIADFARVISQYVDALAIRTHAHTKVEELAKHSTIPIINALSEDAHPCQAMADVLTIREELPDVKRPRVVFVGDGNNVARSLAVACEYADMDFMLTAPSLYKFPADFVNQFTKAFGHAPAQSSHPLEAATDADVIYTDVWTSMGQEAETQTRLAAFADFQINRQLVSKAHKNAIILHCLPAHRGEEITEEVLDGPASRIIPQAANRMHFQKALIVWLITGWKNI